MFGIIQLSIDFLTDSLYLVIPAFLVVIALSVYLYLKTNPPIPKYLRFILGMLRIVAVTALFLALFEPVISYTLQFERPVKIAMLLDESLSMDKIENDKSRKVRRDSLLSTAQFERFNARIDLLPYYFGGNLEEKKNQVKTDETAMGEALFKLESEELASKSDLWLLLSDGNTNSGQSPKKVAASLSAPVMTVDLSAGGGNFDVGITEVNYNPVQFSGIASEIKVKLNWQNSTVDKINIQLIDSSKVINESKLDLQQPEGLSEVILKYLPTAPGQKILNINIPVSDNEDNIGNNSRSFSVKILKSKLTVLLMSDQADYEVGFLKRFLEQSEKYEVDLKLTGSQSGNLRSKFPSKQTELNRYDLVILHDPNPNNISTHQKIIESYLKEKGGALWVVMGNQYNKNGNIDWFNKLLPFYPSVQSEMIKAGFKGEPSEGKLFHPVVRLGQNQTEIRKNWSELPPFQSLVKCDITDPNASVLAYAGLSETTKLPLLGYKRIGPGKVLASSALPFWSWGFVNLGFGEDDSFYGKFIESTASWLTVADDLEPIRIHPTKDVYNRGEIVRFDGFAYDLGFRPIPEVAGTIKMINRINREEYDTDLLSLNDGKYKAEFTNLKPAEYHYAAKFVKDDMILKQVDGKILVEAFSLEEFDQSGNPAVLQAVANLSGGRFYRIDEFNKMIESINTEPVLVQRYNEIVLWNKLWLLIMFISALVIEWLIRKMNHLI